MQWLQNALLFSKAPFKIIVTGSQVLNPKNKYECMQEYPFEYNQLLNFLADKKIKGVIFLMRNELVGLFPSKTRYGFS